jgi:AraC family transcriptional regulator
MRVPRTPALFTEAEIARLEAAKKFIEENALRGSECDLVAVAKEAGQSPFHLHRRFKQHFGQTPKEIASTLQVEMAKKLILQGVPMPQIAQRCGFAHQSHFVSRFRMKTGVTPTKWRWFELRKLTGPVTAAA